MKKLYLVFFVLYFLIGLDTAQAQFASLNDNLRLKIGNKKSAISKINNRFHYKDINIVVPSSFRNDKGIIFAIQDLSSALNTEKVFFNEEDVPSSGNMIILKIPVEDEIEIPWKVEKAESYRITSKMKQGRSILEIQAVDKRGLMYGTFGLAEYIRLGKDPYQIKLESSPAFPLRMYSEEGQLLDLPDLNYYSDKSPYVNEDRLRREINEAKKLVNYIAALGFNAITFLHVNFEDYIDYKYLDKMIYPENSIHRQRSAIYCEYMSELCDYAHERHLDIFLQLYEFQYPPELEEFYTIDLHSPDIEKIISAKCRELFERVPLDGLVITPTESHPRCGYRSVHLWEKHGQSGAGHMLSLYHNACKANGRKAIFRLWRVASNAEGAWETAFNIPKDAMFSVKNTGGDFWLHYPLTNVVTDDVGKQYPVMIVFDPFRQYDGWSRAFCYMKKYGERVRLCHEHSISAINAWGAWSPGCIWPTYEPGYMKGSEEEVAWAGYWNQFRIFTRGFSAGQLNVYLLARLMWNPYDDPFDVAKDFIQIHLGEPNAKLAAEALMFTEDAWHELYPIPNTHPVYFKWTMIFDPRRERMEEAYKNYSLSELLESNARAMEKVTNMNLCFDKTNRIAARNKEIYDSFKQAIDLTSLTIRTFCLFREYYWRNHAGDNMNVKDNKVRNVKALNQARSELNDLIDKEWVKYPDEAAYWRITYKHHGKPSVYERNIFPYWWGSDVTLEKFIRE